MFHISLTGMRGEEDNTENSLFSQSFFFRLLRKAIKLWYFHVSLLPPFLFILNISTTITTTITSSSTTTTNRVLSTVFEG